MNGLGHSHIPHLMMHGLKKRSVHIFMKFPRHQIDAETGDDFKAVETDGCLNGDIKKRTLPKGLAVLPYKTKIPAQHHKRLRLSQISCQKPGQKPKQTRWRDPRRPGWTFNDGSRDEGRGKTQIPERPQSHLMQTPPGEGGYGLHYDHLTQQAHAKCADYFDRRYFHARRHTRQAISGHLRRDPRIHSV
jgi:hypothetical protein